MKDEQEAVPTDTTIYEDASKISWQIRIQCHEFIKRCANAYIYYYVNMFADQTFHIPLGIFVVKNADL